VGTQVVYSQENLTGNHNSILLTIYISVLSPCYDFSIPTLMSMPYPYVYYSSIILLPQGQHTIYMCPDIILLISVDHACTMYTPWRTHVPWHHPNPRLFSILLDPKFFQTTLACSRPMISCHVTGKSHAPSSLIVD